VSKAEGSRGGEACTRETKDLSANKVVMLLIGRYMGGARREAAEVRMAGSRLVAAVSKQSQAGGRSRAALGTNDKCAGRPVDWKKIRCGVTSCR